MREHRYGSRAYRSTQARTEAAALLLLASEPDKWMSAVPLAEQVGTKWRPLAFALRRLVERGLAQERIVTYRGTARLQEERREYRLARSDDVGELVAEAVADEQDGEPTGVLELPAWFAPRVLVPERRTARLVVGRAGMVATVRGAVSRQRKRLANPPRRV